jgi:NTP pyrophosphatase (non-canonical NTP hydrolase)
MSSAPQDIESDYFCFAITPEAQYKADLLLATSGVLNSNSKSFKMFISKVNIKSKKTPMFSNAQRIKVTANVIASNHKLIEKFHTLGSPMQCYQYLAQQFEQFLGEHSDTIYLSISKHKTEEKIMESNANYIKSAVGTELLNIQQEVDEWINSVGVNYFKELTNLSNLIEEVGELARLIGREYGEQTFKPNEKPACVKSALADELSDILFIVICLANQMDISLSEAFRLNMDKKTNRDFHRHKNNPALTAKK